MALEYGDIRLQYEDYSPGAVAGGAGLASIELKSMEAATDAEVAEIALLLRTSQFVRDRIPGIALEDIGISGLMRVVTDNLPAILPDPE